MYFYLNFRYVGLDVKFYRYYDFNICGFDFNGVMEDIVVCKGFGERREYYYGGILVFKYFY